MLIRMLSNINKWDGSKVVNRQDAFICGDAIGDLKTTDNRLSVWKADSDEDIRDAVVALSLSRENVGKLAYCLLDEKELLKREISVVNDMKGIAPGLDDSILSKHRDLMDLDYWRIGYLSEYMIDLLVKEENRKFMTASNIKKLLNEYRNNNKIDTGKVKDSLRKHLGWDVP
jgi:hypothetical protein